MLEHGATTAWEWWDAIGDDGAVRGSLNHYSKAAVVSFLYTHVAGIRLDAIPDAASAGIPPRAHRPGPGRRTDLGAGLDRHAVAARSARSGASTRACSRSRSRSRTAPPRSIALPDGTTREVGRGIHSFTSVVHPKGPAMTLPTFPADFLWGVATAGHQNEGDNVDSDTWFLENVTPTVFKDRSGKAANGWELWESDLDLVAGMGLNAYRFSVEWARVEPVEGEFSDEALAHYEAIVDGCLARGLAPIVTFNHFTSPHWFAGRGAWLDPEAPALFARYCGVVMDRFGDRIALAVTFNEPDLPEMLTWAHLPEFIVELERATLAAASEAAGVERYRAGNVMLREDFAGMRAGMTAAHRAAKAAIKARRADLPVGLSLAMVDDVAGPGGEATPRPQARRGLRPLARARARRRLRRRAELRAHRLRSRRSAAARARHDRQRDGHRRSTPTRSRGAVEYAYAVSGVPILVSEHGVSTGRRHGARRLHRAVARGSARGDRRRRAGARLLPLDAHGQLRVDLRLRPEARAAQRRPRDVRAHGQAERGRLRRAGARGAGALTRCPRGRQTSSDLVVASPRGRCRSTRRSGDSTSPRQASRPSRTASPATTSAATESAHHQPSRLFRISPRKTAPDR